MSELRDKEDQYSRLLNYNRIDGRVKNRYIIVFRILFVTLLAAAAAVLIMNIAANYEYIAAIAGSFSDSNTSAAVKTEPKIDIITPAKFNFKMMSRFQNILLLGVDSNGPNTLPFSGVRSDTIIIVSIDNRAKSINAVSIPRDSKVYLADNHGLQKINAAFAIGGIDLTKKTIEETFGIKIHNYIIINSEGVRKAVDAIGGVPVYITRNMDYDDYSAKLHIHLKKGERILNGKDAEGYLRYRKDVLGDIGRVQRQQKFLNALIEKLKTPETLVKIPEIAKLAEKYSRTDLNLYQLPQYASLIRDMDMNKIEFASLPGAPNKKGAVSYWILDPEKTQEMIYRMIYRQGIDNDKPVSAGIIYTRENELYALELKEALQKAGYIVNCAGRASRMSEPAVIGHNSFVTADVIKELKKKVPQISDYKFTYKPVKQFCSNSSIVIIAGREGQAV